MNHRHQKISSLLPVATLALSATRCAEKTPRSPTEETQDRPNIVLIISDDQGWTDYSFMGHPVIRTPQLDKLAGRSLLFERGCVASPLCRPSLASMVTGLYPFQHGIPGNDVDAYNQRTELDVPLREAFHKHPSLIKILTENGYLAEEHPEIVERLKKQIESWH